MNWFKRYGIVGAYFLLITFIWLVCCTSFEVAVKESDNGYPVQFIIVLFTFTFLPSGYILTVFSQTLYYTILGGRKIHREIANILRNEPRWQNIIPGLNNARSEGRCEAMLTAFEKLNPEKLSANDAAMLLKKLKFIAPFCTRRFDVLTINNSIILSTILSPITVNLLITSGLLRRTSYVMLARYYLALSIYTVVLISILMVSSLILGNQIVEIHRSIFNIAEANARRNYFIQLFLLLIRIIIVIGVMYFNFLLFK